MKLIALDYAQRYGWYVFPVEERGKRPITQHGYKDATTDNAQINDWWTDHPESNIGCDCGRSGLVVIDVDGTEGIQNWNSLRDAHEIDASQTAVVRTGSGAGFHLYFMMPQGVDIRNSTGKLAKGLDVRARGGYVVIPPSITEQPYQWERHPDLGIAHLPDMLIRLLTNADNQLVATNNNGHHTLPGSRDAYLQAAIEGELARLRSSVNGTRNDTLNRTAFALGQLGLTQEEIELPLLPVALSLGLTDKESRATIASGVKAGAANPRTIPSSIPPSNRKANAQHITGASIDHTQFPALPVEAQLPTALDTSHEWLDCYIAFSRQWSPRSFEGFHEAVGLWILSTLAARRITAHLGKARYTNLYIALIARTSIYAKSSNTEIGKHTLDAAGLRFLLAPDRSTPQSLVKGMVLRVPDGFDDLGLEQQALMKSKLAFAAQRGWYYEEFGEHLQSMMTKHDNPMTAFRGLLRQFDDCPAEYEVSTIARATEFVERPYLAILGNMTPADMRPFARRGAALWNDGFFARFAFVVPPNSKNPSRARFPRGKRMIPAEIIKPLHDWHNRLGVPEVRIEQEEDAEGKPTGKASVYVTVCPPVTYDYTDRVCDAFYNYHDALNDLVVPNGNEDLDGNYSRFAEKAFRIALLLASVENARQIEIRHWARAQQITEEWRAGLHTLIAQLNQRIPSKKANDEERILKTVARLGRATPAEVQRYVPDLSSGEVAALMQGMEASGLLRAETTTHKGTIRYVPA